MIHGLYLLFHRGSQVESGTLTVYTSKVDAESNVRHSEDRILGPLTVGNAAEIPRHYPGCCCDCCD